MMAMMLQPHPTHTAASTPFHHQALQLELARSITGQQFVEALNDALEPRLKLMGALGDLEKFKSFFASKQLEKGTNIAMLVRTGETLDVVVTPSKEATYSMVWTGVAHV